MKSPLKYLSLAFIILGLFPETIAQSNGDYLILKKEGRKKRYYFYVGETFVYRTVGNDVFNTMTIKTLSDSAVHDVDRYVKLTDIVEVKVQKRTYLLASNKAATYYLLFIVGGTAIMQTSYLINTGALEPGFGGPKTLLLLAPAAVIYSTNFIKKAVTKTRYKVGTNDYSLEPIVISSLKQE